MKKQPKEKTLRALLDASRLYERAKIEHCFKENATNSLLTQPEIEEGLSLINRLFTKDIENESIVFDILNKRVEERVSKVFTDTLKALDDEIPVEFKKCKTIYEIREIMATDFGFASEDKLVDKTIEFSFIGNAYSAKYRLPLHLFNVKNVAKLAELTLRNSKSTMYFIRSLF